MFFPSRGAVLPLGTVLAKVTGKMSHGLATASFLALLLSLPSQLSGEGEARLALLSRAQPSRGTCETHSVADRFFKGSRKNICIPSPMLANTVIATLSTGRWGAMFPPVEWGWWPIDSDQ